MISDFVVKSVTSTVELIVLSATEIKAFSIFLSDVSAN